MKPSKHLRGARSVYLGGIILLLAAVLILPQQHFIERTNLMLYDMVMPVHASTMSDAIVVVAIDDKSIDQLGRWPWSRRVHAKLLDRLTQMNAAAVGFDILLTEAQQSDPLADDALAQAIARSGRVVLSVAPIMHSDGLISELLPIPEFAANAAALGHVDTELDQDGLCRRAFMFSGLNNPQWPTLGLAMLKVAGFKADLMPDRPYTPRDNQEHWARAGHMLVPFASAPPAVISAADILNGQPPAENVRDKFVLIGSTATGLGDALSTPGADAHHRMQGVIFNAHILNALLQNREIQALDQTLQHILNLSLVIIGLGLVAWLRVYISLLALLGLCVFTTGITFGLMHYALLWYSPITVIILLIMLWLVSAVRKIQSDEKLQKQLLSQLQHRTLYQMVSGLPNGHMLKKELQRRIEQTDANTEQLGLVIIHFEWTGSASLSPGCPIADATLRALADKVRTAAPENSYIAHMNGDDFAIIVTAKKEAQALDDIVQSLLAGLQKTIQIGDNRLLLSPEIGVSLWSEKCLNSTDLLRNAYTAMFQSRIHLSEHLCIYSDDLGDQLQMRLTIEKALVQAIEEEQFEVYYQPQIAATSGQVIGVEALLRWHNPQLGWITPDVFIPIAEHVGLIKPLGYWVLERACQQLVACQHQSNLPLRLAVNVSPVQFTDPDLEVGIADIIRRTGINPAHIELEITEGALMCDTQKAVDVMKRIKKTGIDLAIDDFGTGYSSLSNLRHFPFDRLKIDRSFTSEIGSNKDTTEIVLMIISMARQLDLEIIAEGIETSEQAEFLRAHGCHEFQGFFYSRPIPIKDLATFLEQHPVPKPV